VHNEPVPRAGTVMSTVLRARVAQPRRNCAVPIRNAIATTFLALAAACALAGRSTRILPPLQDEGELYVELQPGATGQFTAAAAVRSDGSTVPLELRSPEADAPKVQHLLAEGRLPPGSYSGLALETAKGTTQVRAPFAIEARRAVVLSISAQFNAAIPPRTVAPLSGYVTAAASQDVTVFDKHLREVTAALPTGSAPWGIALDPVSNRGYVALEGEDQVAVVDLTSGAEIARIRLGLGDAPRELLLLPDRRTLVSANSGSNTVSLIDAVSMLEGARIPVGEQPTSLLPDRRSGRIYVFNARSNSISLLDPATRSIIATVRTDNTPLRGQVDRAGARLYVASTASAYLTIYTLPGLSAPQRVYIGLGTTAIKVDAESDLVYVANADGRVSVFDPFSLLPVDHFDVGGGATWMAIDAAEDVLFLLLAEKRSVAAVQLTTRSAAGGFDTGADPRVLALMGERN
jgi:YVTN family beta-propeller protein